MKLTSPFSLSKLHGLFQNTSQLLRLSTLLILIAYVAYLVYFLYANLYSTILVPKPVDPGQVSAKQEKINKKLLDTVKTYDDAKQAAKVPASGSRDPFAP